jgi:hypothetical protein
MGREVTVLAIRRSPRGLNVMQMSFREYVEKEDH